MCYTLRPVATLLQQTRKSRGLSLEEVAAAVSTDATNLSRIERGIQPPKRELARRLFVFYRGVIPLARIHDPDFDEGAAVKASKAATKAARQHARAGA